MRIFVYLNPSHIFREFFVEHKAKIVYIGFLGYPENIVTVDADGYIYNWEYDAEYFKLQRRYFRSK